MVKEDEDLNQARGIANDDFYWENGYIVFTRRYHLKRGYCCGHGCRHCPYKDGEPDEDPPKQRPADENR